MPPLVRKRDRQTRDDQRVATWDKPPLLSHLPRPPADGGNAIAVDVIVFSLGTALVLFNSCWNTF
jgi:hypothetical protein